MKRVFFFCLLLAFTSLALSQVPERGPLKLQSGAIRLCVTRGEELFLTTRAGEVAQASSIGDLWKRIDPVKKREGMGPLIEQANFFNKDTGIVSGYIDFEHDYKIVYRTTDGGANWEAVDFGQSGWVDHAVHLDNGTAWLSVGGSGIAYTEDYGSSWRAIAIPERRQRFTQIYFNTAKEGLIGSLWNMLAWTRDNGTTWRVLPTPLDQKKYNKTNSQSRPEFNRVAIYHDYLLASQEGLVFYTPKDSINWVWLPDYSDFYTDAENSGLYFRTNGGRFVRAGTDLEPLHRYGEKSTVYDAQCRNGSLFVMSGTTMLQLKPDLPMASSPIHTNQPSATEPEMFGFNAAGIFGVIDNKIYQQSGFGGKWVFLFMLPHEATGGRLSLLENGEILFSRNDDSLFYYDLEGKELRRVSKAELIRQFTAPGISELVFSKGSQGCFHNNSSRLVYRFRNGQFEAEDETSTGSGHSPDLPDYEEVISGPLVSDFVNKLPLLLDPACKAGMEDLGFTEADYQQCKKDILRFQASLEAKKKKATAFSFNRNNLDFDRLLHLADSIKYLDRETLNTLLLQDNGFWSTTTNWTSIQLVNRDKKTLTLYSHSYTPKPFSFPWQVNLDGYTSASTCIEINRFVNSAYPLFLGNDQKVEALHLLVKALY